MLLGVPLGQCRATATTLVEGMCKHEHHSIDPLCAWHTTAALKTDLGHCGPCTVADKHVCSMTVRVVPGELDERSS